MIHQLNTLRHPLHSPTDQNNQTATLDTMTPNHHQPMACYKLSTSRRWLLCALPSAVLVLGGHLITSSVLAATSGNLTTINVTNVGPATVFAGAQKVAIYSFTLQDISGTSTSPDLKVIVEPADRSAIVAANGPPQFVPAAQLEQSRQQLAALQSHVEQAVDEYKSAYPTRLKFDYAYKANEAPFNIQSIYHDDRFTYIKTNAPEKFSVYEMKDGKPNLLTYDLREGTYIIPKIMDSGYVELGKKRMEFTRKGSPS